MGAYVCISFPSSRCNALGEPFSHQTCVDVHFCKYDLAAQSILSIPTHFSVPWSVCLSLVCRLSHICTLLKLQTNLGAIWQVQQRGLRNNTMCQMVVSALPPPSEREIWDLTHQPNLAIANCCCCLVNANEKRFRFLPNYFDPCCLLAFSLFFRSVMAW